MKRWGANTCAWPICDRHADARQGQGQKSTQSVEHIAKSLQLLVLVLVSQ